MSCNRLTGAHVNMKVLPELSECENFVSQEYESISIHNLDLSLAGEGGKIWTTNFRIILRFYQTGEIYIANANVLKIEKGITQNYETFTVYSRDLQVFTFGISLLDKRRRELAKQLNTLCFPKSSRNLFCYSFSKKYSTNGWELYDLETEFKRQGINFHNWKISKLNMQYDITTTYPTSFVVLAQFESSIYTLSSNRTKGRFPILSWGKPSGTYLIRTAELTVKENDDITGLKDLQFVGKEEEDLFRSIHTLSGNDFVIIYDTRNKGDIDLALYQGIFKEKGVLNCLGLPTENQLAESLKSVVNYCISDYQFKSASSWLEAIDQTKWIEYIFRAVNFAYSIGKKMITESQTVIMQNLNGNNLCSVMCALIQIFLDPYYRTIHGFCVLIEKEFISIGHKFGNFFSKKKEEDPHSMIFLYFLNCVWQLIHQRPFSFEFTDSLLIYLIDSVYSCQFGTFLASSEKEKLSSSIPTKTASVWCEILERSPKFRNPFYLENPDFLEIVPEKSVLRLWNEYFLRFKCKSSLDKMDRASQTSLYKNVKILELSSVKIPYLSSQPWDQFYFITELNLNNNLIARFPLEIILFRELKKLSLEGNQIPLIPSEFLDLLGKSSSSMQELNLNDNQIHSISNISYFTSLISLKLRGNLIKDLPNLSTLSLLTELDIGGNPLDTIPSEVLKMQSLKRLSIFSTQLKILPSTIPDLINLEYLDISCNNIGSLPDNFSNLSNLLYLNISSNDFPSIPSVIFTFVNLQTLHLSDLRIAEIPDDISKLKNLEILNLSKNNISKLPNSILSLISLKSLDLENNSLTTLPLYIYNLSQLVELYLQHNQLEHLTPGIGNLSKLRVLNIRHNKLRTLPGTIGFVDSLLQSGGFYYDNNEFSSKLEKYDYAELFTKLKLKLTSNVRCYRMKLMLVGQENVGKTSILRCLSEYRKRLNSSSDKIMDRTGKISSADTKLLKATGLDSLSTDGIDIGDLEYIMKMPPSTSNGKREKITVNISAWDFAGQEIYYTTHQFFLSEKAIYLLVWNISKQEENSRVEYWLKSISAKAKNAPIIIVGTHADSPVCTKEYLHETITAFAQKYVKEYPSIIDIIPASCQTGEGVKLIDLNIQSILTSIKEDMGKPVPARYYELENLIKEEGLKKTKDSVPPVVTWDEFQTFGKICATTDDLPEAAAFLHRLGSLNYFPKMPKLRDIYVLHPQWLVDVMCSVITTKHFCVKGGVLEHHLLPQIWRPPTFPSELHQTLLNLLENFEISFYLRSTATGNNLYTGRSLVPSLLPEERPPQLDEKWSAWPLDHQHQYQRRYRFSFIPHGFVSRYLIRLVCLCEPTIIWRHGVLIENDKEGYSILVELLPARKQLDITIRGETGDKMAQLIIDSLNNLIEGWYNLTPDIQIPCIHCVKRKDFDPHIFQMEECEQQAIEGKSFVKCRDIRAVRLDELAPDIAMSHVSSCKLDFRELVTSNQIGEGGFALVYKGTYQGKAVAIKKIKFGSQNAPTIDETTELQAFAEFRREVWIMSGLVHQNLVQLVGFTMDPFCIVSEFMHYGDLYTLLHDESKILTWGYKWRVAIDMAKGMAFLHTTTPPIIHRDLKSPNVLMCSLDERAEAVAKIADFGLSQVLASTAQGRSVANPVWLAPEIMKNEEYTEKVDVYSFGVMLWELATQKDFFGDIKFMSALENRVIEGDRPPIPVETPVEFADLIRACWHNNPDSRPSFTEIIDELAEGIKKYHPNLYPVAIAEREVKIIRPKNQNIVEKKIRTQEEIEREKREIEEARKEFARREMAKFSRQLEPVHTSSVQCMICVPANPNPQPQIWVGTSEGIITVWNLDGSHVMNIPAHAKSIYCMIYINESIWTSSAESVIRVFTKQGKIKKEIKLANYAVLCFASVDKKLWAGTTDSNIQLFDPKGCKAKKKVKVIENGPVCCIFCEYKFQKVWVGTDYPEKYIIRLTLKGKPLDYIIGHSSKVNCILEADNLIWSCSNDRTIRIWHPDNADCLKILHAHSGPVYSLSTSSEYVWSASWDKSVIIWDARCQAFLKEFEAHQDAVSCLLHLTNQMCWSGSWDRTLLVWDPNVTKF